jgi:hypothetical protein
MQVGDQPEDERGADEINEAAECVNIKGRLVMGFGMTIKIDKRSHREKKQQGKRRSIVQVKSKREKSCQDDEREERDEIADPDFPVQYLRITFRNPYV